MKKLKPILSFESSARPVKTPLQPPFFHGKICFAYFLIFTVLSCNPPTCHQCYWPTLYQILSAVPKTVLIPLRHIQAKSHHKSQ